MKKIIALVLTAAMVMGMCTAVFVAEANPDEKSTTVSYEKQQSYTWSVPDTLTAGGQNGTVSASEVYIPYNKTLTISIKSGVSADNKITLTDKTNSSNSITASVTYTNLTVAAGAENLGGSQTISIGTPECNIAGTYKATITFEASVA